MLMLLVFGAPHLPTIDAFARAYMLVLAFSLPGYVLYRAAVWKIGRATYALASFFGAIAGILPMALISHGAAFKDLRMLLPLGIIGAIGGVAVLTTERLVDHWLSRVGRKSAKP